MTKHRVLYMTDAADPLCEKVLAVAEGRLEVEVAAGGELPDSLHAFDAVLIGDVSLADPLPGPRADGPKIVQLTRGHHPDVDAAGLINAGTTVAGAAPVLAGQIARHALGLAIAAGSDQGPRGLQIRESIAADVDSAPNSLREQTVGIIGFGRTGQAMAALCSELGATVIYADIRTAQHGSAAAVGARRLTLDLLLSKSDIVSIHVQWGPTADPLITERELRLMGRDSVLVNTADARLVETKALSEVLNSGRLRAGLDVPEPAASQLAQAPNSVVTPYVAARSERADADVAKFVVGNIETALSGEEPSGVIEIIDFPRAGDPAFWSSKMAPRSAG